MQALYIVMFATSLLLNDLVTLVLMVVAYITDHTADHDPLMLQAIFIPRVDFDPLCHVPDIDHV